MSDDAGTRAVRAKAERARTAALSMQGASDATRRDAVAAIADAVDKRRGDIEGANKDDVAAASKADLAAPLLDRLELKPAKFTELTTAVRQVARLPDPLGRTVRAIRMDDGLDLYQVTVPLGVVGVVFESRPDALVQISSLAVRSGNAVLLKGGKEAEATNKVLAEAIRGALEAHGIPPDAVQLLEGRAEVQELLAMDDLVDLIVPRGSSSFVRHIMDNTRIPVMGHAEGVCHIYVDEHADPDEALRIIVDAKTDYPAACNAVETVLVHRKVADTFLPRLRDAALGRGIELIEDPSGFGKEFGDLRMAVAVVDGADAAVTHINRYGSKHTDAIVTDHPDVARRFVVGVDAASVLVNASTRFADGFRYGLGAEVGIATSKLHARGPVGLDGLTTTKFVVLGSGQRAGDYQGPHAKPFDHMPIAADLEEAW